MFVFQLSGITTFYCLMSSALKTFFVVVVVSDGKVVLVPVLEKMSRITSRCMASATLSLEFSFLRSGRLWEEQVWWWWEW